MNDPPHATNRNTNCLAISVKHSERITAAATVGPRGAGNAYIDRSVRSGKRSRYSNSDVDVDSNISCASSEESVAIAAADAFVVLGFPLLVAGGDGPPSPPDAAPFRFVPAIALESYNELRVASCVVCLGLGLGGAGGGRSGDNKNKEK